MCKDMETNKWLRQPRPNGPIHLRVGYTDREGNRKTFTRSLNTANWPEARRIRDTEFAPIILSIEKAKTQLDLIHSIFPELERKLEEGVHGGYAEQTPPSAAYPVKASRPMVWGADP